MVTLDQINLATITPEELGELLISAKKAYYTGGKPIMDDHTYDTLEEVLRQKSPHHRLFSKVGTPNFDTGFDKKKHVIPMGSQNKVTNLKNLIHYFELKNNILNKKNLSLSLSKEGVGGWIGDFVVQPKCDGISLEIEYQNGKLINAITRGDGFVGDLITQNVVKMKNIVLSLSKDFSGSIRCEIVVTKDDFKKLNKTVETHRMRLNNELVNRDVFNTSLQNGEELYSNPRNAASGISQRLDGKYSEFCSLMAVDILSVGAQRAAPIQNVFTEQQKISELKSLGFTPVDSFLCHSFEEIEKIYQKFLQHERLNYPYEIDGLVIKINDQKIAQKLGMKNNRPKFQVAYKFPADSNTSQIKNIVWQVGPMGSITPVAEIEPIELSGAIITFASLGNYDLVIEKNLNIGDIVEISRRGDVIPHIEKLVSKLTPNHIEIPTLCPSCQTPLVKEDKFIRCPNSQNCLPQILGSLRLFCDTLGILGLSEKTITKLYQAQKIKLPGDFYKLKIDDISHLDNLGEKSAKNIINQIQNKKVLSLKQVFDAAIIPNFSAARIQQLITAGFNTPEKLLNISQNEIESLFGFQKTLAEKIVTGIKLRRSWIKSIIDNVEIKNLKLRIRNLSLQDLSFAITGDLSMPRPKFIELIESNGGKFVSSVSKNTTYLLTNESESTSAKFTTAKKLGVKIINEKQFQQLLSSQGS